ncbi:MAG: glycosidase, partial [Clostridia bacterium]|nr:glycosidase [Clostridia bacterium]
KETFCEAEAEEKNGFSLCEDMTNPYLSDDFLSGHIGVEEYNGSGSVQIKTDQGWIHIFCETQKTASGLHTAVYAFATALEMPGKVIAKPGGVLLDLDCNACGKATAVDAIVENNDVYLYFTAGDGCIRVATIALDRLMDYVFHTPENRTRSIDSVKQRCLFIAGNLQYLHCLNCKKELNLE